MLYNIIWDYIDQYAPFRSKILTTPLSARTAFLSINFTPDNLFCGITVACTLELFETGCLCVYYLLNQRRVQILSEPL